MENDRQLVSFVVSNIYKPILTSSPFDGRKPLDISEMSGFTWRSGTEPAKLLAVDISLETDGNTFEFSKLQIAKIKKAIESMMTEAEQQTAMVEFALQ